MAAKEPIIFLKTKSQPTDNYEKYFDSRNGATQFEPSFIPVLMHRIKPNAVTQFTEWLEAGAFSRYQHKFTTYGGIIFTSQRAVEVFSAAVANVLENSSQDLQQLIAPRFPFYVVGPATANALHALQIEDVAIVGEHTGNGGALANFIRDDYGLRTAATGYKKPLMFVTGEQRSDAVSGIMHDSSHPPSKRFDVIEEIVYETTERLNFAEEFACVVDKIDESVSTLWVVVFSPTGCRAMLDGLGRLRKDGSDRGRQASKAPHVFIVTIGPTTRDYLMREFECTPDVCARNPTPEGLYRAIEEFRSGEDAISTMTGNEQC